MSCLEHTEDDEQHDLEVATVLATGLKAEFSRNEGHPRRHSTPGRYGASPCRSATVLTNVSRGNTATVTPSRQYSPGLHQVAGQGELLLLQQMMEEHDVNLRDEQGMTPLMWAAANGQRHATQLLLVAGADADLCGQDGQTAVMLAAAGGHQEVLSMLLAKGADVNAVSKSLDSALLYAVHQGHVRCVKMLLEWGADISCSNKMGISPMEAALRLGHKHVHIILRDHMMSLLDPV